MRQPSTDIPATSARSTTTPVARKNTEGLIEVPSMGDSASTKSASRLFVIVVVLATVSPLALGLNLGKFAPRLPSLDWTLAIDQRVRDHADTITGRKIIFVGGSNLRFGLDTQSLSKDLGIPVVNYGLHASLGIDVIADRAAQIIKPGDIVVYAPELSHFRKGGEDEFSDDLRIDFLAAHPSAIDQRMQSSPTREWYRARSRCSRVRSKAERKFADVLARVTERFSPPSESAPVVTDASQNPYDPAGIGPDGQITARRLGPNPPGHWSLSDPPSRIDQMDLVASRGVEAFELLKSVCDSRGATLCVMPPMRVSVDKFKQSGILPGILEMERVWTAYCTHEGATLLMEPGDNVLDMEYGFDTDYHLNERGVAKMQPRIEAALERILKPTTQQ